MKKKGNCLRLIFLLIVVIAFPVNAQTDGETAVCPEELQNLYAQSAVLMDADSGRILFAKEGQKEMAMASTTKIMTCILALEHTNLDQVIEVSANAQKQPEVKLGIRMGEQYVLRDLLYSLMLESHNDSAVAIAEGIGGTVENFALMMNNKAKELGCEQTYFITPNGLDASDENGFHHTTAEDLARIMKYCIHDSPVRSVFLEITQTPSYQFSDQTGTRSFSCQNHNAYLHMMDGALSGKTGFTADAGYCYVGAVKREDREFIVALLACGWPGNKSYKWSDTRKMMEYGLEHYHYKTVQYQLKQKKKNVENGIPDAGFSGPSTVSIYIPDAILEPRFLLHEEEAIRVNLKMEKNLSAPVRKNEKIGSLQYLLGDTVLRELPVLTGESVKERNYLWVVKQISKTYALK
ncbi:MAG: D-alanyl-D-alanine carboxypeptidase [Hespellia sp.]|nr:D-alanyl-D-alanine carboxypeptidase [Hespellia sp.]